MRVVERILPNRPGAGRVVRRCWQFVSAVWLARADDRLLDQIPEAAGAGEGIAA